MNCAKVEQEEGRVDSAGLGIGIGIGVGINERIIKAIDVSANQSTFDC